MKPFRFSYYHRRISQSLRFLVPPQKRILYYGEYRDNRLEELNPSYCEVINYNQPDTTVKTRSGNIRLINSAYKEYQPREKFDYIILNGAVGETTDICKLFRNIRYACDDSTRIILYQHNYIWQGIINSATYLGLKRKDRIQSWLSINDLDSCLTGSGFKRIRTFRRTIFPIKLWVVGPVLNFLADIIPFVDLLKLDQFILARPVDSFSMQDKLKSLSIVLTVRNEKPNIEPIVISLNDICDKQEIVFVEGHSTDGTREEIRKVIAKYPKKNIRLIIQPGIGQNDAIHIGFKEAKGDVIVLYEGDGTSDPEDIQYFYHAICSGRFDFVEGSRFIYPLDSKSMPFFNKVGNVIFARWFSWFLGQFVTDVLSGIKAISKVEYETLEQHWGFLGPYDPFGDFELLYGVFRFGLNYCEIPMRYRPRPYCKSKTNVFRHGFYLLVMAFIGYKVFRSTYTKEGYNL